MEIEITSLEDLDPAKIYHVAVKADASAEHIGRLSLAIQKLGLRALITRDEVKFESFLEMFDKLPAETKESLLLILSPKSL